MGTIVKRAQKAWIVAVKAAATAVVGQRTKLGGSGRGMGNLVVTTKQQAMD